MFAVAFSGARELDRALATLARSMPRPFIKGVMLGAAKPLVKAMRRNVRVGTGDLKKSVKARVRKNLKKIVVVTVGPGKDQFWGMFLEFGTAHHGKYSWMRPAWEEKKDEALEMIVASFAMQLNKVARRINRKIARGKKLTRFELRLLGA